MSKKKTTKLDILKIIYQALNSKSINGDKVIQVVEYDGDNHNGTVQIILKDGTSWFLSSEDIQKAEDFDD